MPSGGPMIDQCSLMFYGVYDDMEEDQVAEDGEGESWDTLLLDDGDNYITATPNDRSTLSYQNGTASSQRSHEHLVKSYIIKPKHTILQS
jgi:hypothetical protein